MVARVLLPLLTCGGTRLHLTTGRSFEVALQVMPYSWESAYSSDLRIVSTIHIERAA